MPLVIITGPLIEYLYDFDFQSDKQQETDFGILIKACEDACLQVKVCTILAIMKSIIWFPAIFWPSYQIILI